MPPLPHPNGYETLLTIAGQVKPPTSDLGELAPAQVRELADQNRSALAQVPAALEQKSGVPLHAEQGWGDRHEEELKKLKALAVALGVQAQADLAQGRTNEAVDAHLLVLLLGQTMAQGGILVDGITSLAVETLGVGLLRGDLPRLDAAKCRALAQRLEQAEARRESPQAIFDRERKWAAASYGLVATFGSRFIGGGEAKRQAQFESRRQQTVRRTRRLILQFAARAYELEQGKPPAQPMDLVPQFLSVAPLDPGTGKPFKDLPTTGTPD